MTDPFTDRYATGWRLASQVESEWGDVLLGKFLEARVPAAGRLGFETYLSALPYHTTAARWLAASLPSPAHVRTCADIGAGLGRFIVELLKELPGLHRATYVEPSPTLFRWTETLFEPDATVTQTPFLSGLAEVGWHHVAQSAGLAPSVTRRIQLVHGSAEEPSVCDLQFDLVSVLNVLDQCAHPSRLASRALSLVAPGGYAFLSCAHQFQPHLFIDAGTVFASLHDLFQSPGWSLVAETELSFASRTGERHRNLFLSHHVLYQRVA